MYDPVTARFLQADTYTGSQSDPLSLNLYTYCMNNPERYIDPSGHIAIELAVIVISAVVAGMAVEAGIQKFIEKKVCIDYNRIVGEGLFSGAISAISFGTGNLLKCTIGPLAAKNALSTGTGLTAKTLAAALIANAAGGAASEAAEEMAHQFFVEGRTFSQIDYRQIGISAALGTVVSAGSTLAGAGIDRIKAKRAAKAAGGIAGNAEDMLPARMQLQYFAGEADGGGSTTTYKILNTSSAEDVNKIFKDTMGYEPPYKPGTSVTEIELTENVTYVRVYDKVNSRVQGGWVMKAEDIAGLTPQEIQNKFALPNTPKYICDVNLEAGTRLRTGEVNPLFGFDGGGQQYDLIINEKRVGKFINERIIGQ